MTLGDPALTYPHFSNLAEWSFSGHANWSQPGSADPGFSRLCWEFGLSLQDLVGRDTILGNAQNLFRYELQVLSEDALVPRHQPFQKSIINQLQLEPNTLSFPAG